MHVYKLYSCVKNNYIHACKQFNTVKYNVIKNTSWIFVAIMLLKEEKIQIDVIYFV